MNNTAEYVGIWNISKGDYKFPTLAELVTKIFYPAKDPEFNFVSDIDTSQQQVFAVAKCLVKLLEIGRIEDQYHKNGIYFFSNPQYLCNTIQHKITELLHRYAI